MPVTATLETVTTHASEVTSVPSVAVAVIFAVPADTATTLPVVSSTVATEGFDDAHVSVVLAPAGVIVDVSVLFSPTLSDNALSITIAFVKISVTVTSHEAVKLPSTVVAVIFVVPAFNNVKTPPVTVATASLEDVHVTF